MKQSDSIAVLGAGSWGTALALHLARNKQTVYLWDHNPAQVKLMQTQHCNKKYLPDFDLPNNIHVSHDLTATVTTSDDVLVVVPSHAFRETLLALKPHVTVETRLAWATKGFDPENYQPLHALVAEILGDLPMAVISGPNFAKEVAANLPTAITVASHSPAFAADLTARLHSKTFRVYTSHDVIGVELGSAMKNVLAIAVGIADGLGFGANARSALITRGLTEMIRLGRALGGHIETFLGLAGVGDLVLTCTDNQSRNRRFGLALGAGQSMSSAEKSIGQVIEGISATRAIHHLAQQLSIETPISEQVYQVLYQGVAPHDAVEALLSRDPRAEGI